jgi:DNA-binding NtrC family response regulator
VKPRPAALEPATLDGSVPSAEDPVAPVWKLRVVYSAGEGVVQVAPVPWTGAQPLPIGRGAPSAASGPYVSIQDERVSRQHARLLCRGNQVSVEDLHSRNGSACNGVKLAAGVPVPVHDGDILRFGDSFAVLRHEPDRILDAAVPSYVGVSRAACQLRCAIVRCAQHARPVLLLGETGTGKEVTAQALHQLSRRPGRLVAVNCAAIPAPLAEAQLFGVARGAFTGALERPGAFAEADGGTLFLDELGELPLELQPKLLRALDSGEVLAVGGAKAVRRDVRIIAATNRDLGEALRQRAFREDLYARLASEVLRLPPLHERREDILLLASRFAGPGFRPSPRLVAALLAHRFPLNAREVHHLVARLQDRSEAEVIAQLADERAAADAALPPPTVAPPRWQSGDPMPSAAQVAALLQEHRGNLSHIEARCGYSRRQFRRWVADYGIDLAAYRKAPAS